MGVNLLTNATTDTDGDGVSYNGGKMAIFAWGNFGGGELTIEVLAPDGVTWVPAYGATWFTDMCKQIELPPARVRASLVGAISPNVSCAIVNY